jgi:alkanesulfonate monooxygenase SsuD/methylene tetrahydromethanopterin reductase-like flavin-dependent oxidoreductase (luciferase family)
VHVAGTTDQAWDEAERGLHWWVEFYRRRGMQMPLAPVGELRHDPKAAIYGVPFAVGTPDQVIEKLRAYQDLPMDEMAIQFHHPGMDPGAVAASMRLFAAELLPEIQGWGTAA